MSPSEQDHEPAGAIVMTTFNRAGRALASVERLLQLPERWPIVVVDDASTDDTSGSLRRRFTDELRVGRLQVLTLDRNLGSTARTVGVAAVDVELIAFADDDSWWADGALTEAAHIFRDHADIGLLAAAVLVEPDRRPDPIVEALQESPLPSAAPGPSVLGFLACGAIVRRRAYLEVGGFHPLFHIGGEEELLALDLRSAGWRVVHVPGVVAHHAPEHGDGGRDARRDRLVRNQLLVQWLRRPLRSAVSSTAAVATRAVTHSSDRRVFTGVLTTLPGLLRERRTLPDAVESDVRRLEGSVR